MTVRNMELVRTSVGLMLHPNEFSLPEGSLLEAENVVIDGPGRISKHRGVNRYGDELALPASAMGEFNGTVIVLDGTTLKYDSDGSGTWASMAGTFARPDSLHRMRFVEAIPFALYFSTSLGVFRLDALGNAPVQAGMPQGLDIETTFAGIGLGWMLGNTQVGYRVRFVRVDSNAQEIPGAASFREVVTNSKTDVTWAFAAGTVTVTHIGHGYTTGDTVEITEASEPEVELPTSTITVTGTDTYTYTIAGTPGASGTAKAHRTEEVELVSTIPDGVVAGDFYEVYRTEMSADDTTDPGARYLRVDRVAVAAADIAAGAVMFVDDFDEAFLGEELDSNPTAEGSDQTNDRPPFARDLALFRGHMFYANTRQPHQLALELKDASALSDGATITIGARTYTASTTAENIATQTFFLEENLTTEAENIEATMKSLVRVANRDSGNSVFYLYYTSGALEPPGRILIRRRDFVTTALAVTANSTATGDQFTPVLPTSGTSVSTTSDDVPNRLYRSKHERPDSVPLLNYDDVGASRDAILRIVPLRDSLIIFTERSIYRLSGEDEQTFTTRVLESSVRLLCPESPAVLNDAVHCYTSQGVTAVNENGARVESFFACERELNKIQNFTDFETLTWGIAYEQDRKYILWTQSESGDTTPTRGWIFNYLTNTWTRRPRAVTAGVVLKEADRIYLAHAVDPFVLKERKSFETSNTDFVDEDIPITIDAVGTALDADGNTVSQLDITFTYTTADLAEEWLVEQNFSSGRIIAVVDNGGGSFTVTLDSQGTYVTGAAIAALPILSRIRWAPEVAGNAAAQKFFSYLTVQCERDEFREMRIGFVSDVWNTAVFLNPIIVFLTGGWGSSPWSTSPWGGDDPLSSTPMRVPVPRRFRRCRGLGVIVEHTKARASFEIAHLGYEARLVSGRTTR